MFLIRDEKLDFKIKEHPGQVDLACQQERIFCKNYVTCAADGSAGGMDLESARKKIPRLLNVTPAGCKECVGEIRAQLALLTASDPAARALYDSPIA